MVNDNTLQLVLHELQQSLPELVPDVINDEHLLKALSDKINFLITNDFSRLIYVLYRLDISEKKLSYLLGELKGTNAGEIIAGMIVERQLQKIKTKQAFSPAKDIPDEDKW